LDKKKVLIAIEGVSAAGKSTLVGALVARLGPRARDLRADLQAPGSLDDELAGIIHRWSDTLTAEQELLLFAGRIAGLARAVRDAKCNDVLVADRYVTSLQVLSIHIRGLEARLVEHVISVAVADQWPTVIISLDVTPEAAFERRPIDYRSHVAREGSAFVARARSAYRSVLAAETQPVHWIDTTDLTCESVADDAWTFLTSIGIL
jgi:thymidylate kinase